MPHLFKITKNGKINHLYGTIHLDLDELNNLSTETKLAFEQSSSVILELRSEENNKLNDCLISKFDDWKKQNAIDLEHSPTDYITLTETKKIAKIFEDELLESHPSHEALFKLMDTTPMLLCAKIILKKLHNLRLTSSTNVLDKQIENQAKLVRKPIASLDTPEDLAQRILGFQFTYKEQVEYAKQFFVTKLTSNENEKENAICLLNSYLNGNYEELIKTDLNDSVESSIAKSLKNSLVYERNLIFAKAMLPHLETGNAFFAFGVLHIPGVLSLLKEWGYMIEPVQEGKRLHNIKTLKNTNTSLREINLLSDYNLFMKDTNCHSFFNTSEKGFILQDKEDLSIFRTCINNGKIDKNHKIIINCHTQYNIEELNNIVAILKEKNVPKSINLTLSDNSSDENITLLSEIFKEESACEELNISFYSPISDQGLQTILETLKIGAYTGKLSLYMGGNQSYGSSLYREINSFLELRNKVKW